MSMGNALDIPAAVVSAIKRIRPSQWLIESPPPPPKRLKMIHDGSFKDDGAKAVPMPQMRHEYEVAITMQ
jgi:hypothetical protein